MNRLLVLALAAFATLAMVHADLADAARMGGGRSFGMQRSITPPAARTAPSTSNSFNGPAANPVMPAKPGATAARLPRPPARRRGGHGVADIALARPARRHSPPGSASPRCSRISACPKGSAACC